MTRKTLARRRPGGFVVPRTYSMLDELAASPTEPMPAATREAHLARMWAGLTSIERAPCPTVDDWRVCSDAVNMLETLVAPAPKGCGVLQDPDGLLDDAVRELAAAGIRHQETGAHIRLTAAGIHAVRSILEDYAEALAQLPARVFVRAHRITERRIGEILRHGSARGVRVCNL